MRTFVNQLNGKEITDLIVELYNWRMVATSLDISPESVMGKATIHNDNEYRRLFVEELKSENVTLSALANAVSPALARKIRAWASGSAPTQQLTIANWIQLRRYINNTLSGSRYNVDNIIECLGLNHADIGDGGNWTLSINCTLELLKKTKRLHEFLPAVKVGAELYHDVFYREIEKSPFASDFLPKPTRSNTTISSPVASSSISPMIVDHSSTNIHSGRKPKLAILFAGNKTVPVELGKQLKKELKNQITTSYFNEKLDTKFIDKIKKVDVAVCFLDAAMNHVTRLAATVAVLGKSRVAVLMTPDTLVLPLVKRMCSYGLKYFLYSPNNLETVITKLEQYVNSQFPAKPTFKGYEDEFFVSSLVADGDSTSILVDLVEENVPDVTLNKWFIEEQQQPAEKYLAQLQQRAALTKFAAVLLSEKKNLQAGQPDLLFEIGFMAGALGSAKRVRVLTSGNLNYENDIMGITAYPLELIKAEVEATLVYWLSDDFIDDISHGEIHNAQQEREGQMKRKKEQWTKENQLTRTREKESAARINKDQEEASKAENDKQMFQMLNNLSEEQRLRMVQMLMDSK